MKANSVITAETSKGIISIKAGSGLLRSISWDGTTRQLELVPPKLGEKYFFSRIHTKHGVRVPSYDWLWHKGITRGEMWEGNVNFTTEKDALAWLKEEQSSAMPIAWSKRGLVVGWSTDVDQEALTIVLQQILVNGRQPDNLVGGSKGVRVSFPNPNMDDR